MPQLEYFLISESISIDQISNRISIFHVLEEARSPVAPFHITELVATSAWNLEEDEIGREIQVSLRIIVPGAAEPINIQQDFMGERRRHRLNAAIIGLQVQGFGDLVFEILEAGVRRATHTVSVIQQDPGPALAAVPVGR